MSLAGVKRHQPVIAEDQRQRRHFERPEIDQQRLPGSSKQRRELVEQAAWTPTQRCSIRWQSRASSRRCGGSAPDAAVNARHSEIESAAEEERPLPLGTSPVISRRAPRTGTPAAPELGGGAPHEPAPVGVGVAIGFRLGEGIGSQLIESERLGLFQVQRLCLDPRLV